MLLSRSPLAVGLIVAFCTFSIRLVQADEPANAADITGAQKAYEGFLRALKANDLAAAKKHWVISDNNKSGVLDILIGYWITQRRLNAAIRGRFSAADQETLRHRDIYSVFVTNEAIDRTIERLKHSWVEIRRDRAKLWVDWQDADGREEQPTFHWSGGFPLASFRKNRGAWRIDANKEIAYRQPADYLEPTGWYYVSPASMEVNKRLLHGIETGKLRSAEDVKKESDKAWKEVEPKAEADRRTRTLSIAETRFFAAHKTWQRWMLETMCGRGSTWGVNRWSRRLLEAEQGLGRGKFADFGAAEDHLDRVRDVRDLVLNRVAYGRYDASSYMGADYDMAEARIQLAKARGATLADMELFRALTKRAAAAELIYENWLKEFRSAEERRRIQMSLVTGAAWARLCLEACQALVADEPNQAYWAEMYLGRMDEIAKFAGELRKTPSLSLFEDSAVRYYHADAECAVAASKKLDDSHRPELAKTQKRRLDSAKAAYAAFWPVFKAGRESIENGYQWSLHWQNAALALGTTNTERIQLSEAHLVRMKDMMKQTREWERAGRVPTWEKWAMEYFVAEAEIRLNEAKRK